MTERRTVRWADLTRGQQRAIVAGGVVELAATAWALTDLVRRPAARVRGPKSVWALACAVQPFGPILYGLIGRRRRGPIGPRVRRGRTTTR